MQERRAKQEYTRADVRRMLGISEQRLRSWERRGLVTAGEPFSFSDLISLRTLQSLRQSRIPAKRIGRALESLRERFGPASLAEMKLVPEGRRIAVQMAGERMEAISGQLLFNFEGGATGVKTMESRGPERHLEREAEDWFQRGLAIEEAGAPIEQAIEAYEKAVELNPTAAGALVNLGTIEYRRGKFRSAEQYYLRAATVDTQYALAQFNLGNLYDEMGKPSDAEGYYRRALEINPTYADAHFNMALLRERDGDTMGALRHWKNYLRLDSTSSWAEIARREVEKLKQSTLIRVRE